MERETSQKWRRWRVLPPDSHGECDFDPALATAGMKASVRRRDTAVFQATEAVRLARDYALLEAGTMKREINLSRLEEVKAAAAAWQRLALELSKKRRTF